MQVDFSTKRFLLLFRKFVKEHYKLYVLYSIGLFGILFVIYGFFLINALFSLFPEFPSGIQEAIFGLGLVLGGSIFTAGFYGFFSNQSKAIQFLQFPASHLEKILLGFIFTQIIFFITFLAMFVFTDWCMCGLYNRLVVIPQNTSLFNLPYYKATQFLSANNYYPKKYYLFFYAFFILTSIAHFGSLAFKKHAFIKTSIVFIVSIALLSYFNQLLALLMPIKGEIMPHGKFFTDSFRLGPVNSPTAIITLPEAWIFYLSIIIPLLVYMLFWLASYYKLKEKQV